MELLRSFLFSISLCSCFFRIRRIRIFLALEGIVMRMLAWGGACKDEGLILNSYL